MTDILPESDHPDYDTEQAVADLRGLVLSGGLPFLLLCVTDAEAGTVELTHAGIDPAVIPAALRDIANQFEAGSFQ